MPTLAELQARKVYTSRTWAQSHKIFIVAGLKGVTSHLIHNLLFRLENTENGATVVLYNQFDPEIVRDTDVKTGLYVPQDVGKECMDVLIGRYNGVFSTSIISGSQLFLNNLIQGINIESGVYFLDLSDDGFPSFQDAFNGLVRYRSENGAGNQNPLVYIRAYTEQTTSTLHVRLVNTRGVVLGDEFRYGEELNISGVNDDFLRNQLLSVYTFNYINALISEEMFVEFHQLYGDLLEGEDSMHREYFTPPILTIFDDYVINAGNLEKAVLVEFRDAWNRNQLEVTSNVLDPFLSRFAIHRGRKHIIAIEYIKNVYGMLDYGLQVLARNRDKRDLSYKLKELLFMLNAKGEELASVDDENILNEYLRDYLTFLQYMKSEDLWFI